MKIIKAVAPLLGIALTNAVVNVSKNIPYYIYDWVKSKLTTRIEITSSDPAYHWIQMWLANNDFASKSNRLRLISASRNNNFIVGNDAGDSKEWVLTAGSGSHFFKKGKQLMIVSRYDSGMVGKGSPESLCFEIFGRDLTAIKSFLEEARALMSEDNTTSIHMYAGYWYKVSSKAPRQPETVILPGNQKERILADLENFYSKKDWYTHRGIPYHRGYLFSGLPGSGKTSVVDVMASKFNKSVAAMSLSSMRDDDTLFDAILNVPKNCIIVMEDIDCVQVSHDRKDKKEDNGGITLQGLLNCLDGIITPEGAVFVMTTNHPDKLDPALIRPGRADVHEVFEYLAKDEQGKLSALYYDKSIQGINKKLPASTLQEIFMRYPDDRLAAQSELKQLEKSS